MKFIVYNLFFLLSVASFSQERTVGLIDISPTEVESGYYLIAPLNSETVYVINECGELINSWESIYRPGNTEYLTKTGGLIAAKNLGGNPLMGAGGQGGLFEEYDWNGNLLWSYQVSDSAYLGHHDFRIMPNGNILLIAWEYKSYEDAVMAGRDSSLIDGSVWSETIFEIKPIYPDSAEIVWQWNLWDHLIQDYDPTRNNYGVVADNPQLINVNYVKSVQADWIHANGLDYNEELDQIIISNHRFDEFFIIDHSTTTEEASTNIGGNSDKGGDLLFRWGNPRTFDAHVDFEKILYGQHNVNWIDNSAPNSGSIIIFNNGNGRPDSSYSEVLMITPTMIGNDYLFDSIYEIDDSQIIYRAEEPTSFYAPIVSGGTQLSNGNFLISNGPKGEVFEFNPINDEIVWKYRVPTGLRGDPFEQGVSLDSLGSGPVKFNFIFRANKYAPSFEGFNGLDLSPNGFIELNQEISLCEDSTDVVSSVQDQIQNQVKVYPTLIKNRRFYIQFEQFLEHVQVDLYNINGDLVLQNQLLEAQTITELNIPLNLPKGVYFINLSFKKDGKDTSISRKVVLM